MHICTFGAFSKNGVCGTLKSIYVAVFRDQRPNADNVTSKVSNSISIAVVIWNWIPDIPPPPSPLEAGREALIFSSLFLSHSIISLSKKNCSKTRCVVILYKGWAMGLLDTCQYWELWVPFSLSTLPSLGWHPGCAGLPIGLVIVDRTMDGPLARLGLLDSLSWEFEIGVKQ